MNRIYAPAFRFGMLLRMSKRQDAAARWREIVRRQTGSSLSVAAFCRRARIPQASFYAWRRKLRDAVAFTEARVSPEQVRAAGALELVLAGGRRIVVQPGFERATLLALSVQCRGTNIHGISEVPVREDAEAFFRGDGCVADQGLVHLPPCLSVREFPCRCRPSDMVPNLRVPAIRRTLDRLAGRSSGTPLETPARAGPRHWISTLW